MKSILSQLPNLTQQELAIIRAACDHLLVSPLETAPALYSALLDVLGQKGPSYACFKLTASWKLWKKNLQETESFISGLWPNMTKNQEASISCFLLQLLADDLKAMKVPVTIGAISSNLGRVPAVFDRNFPDYRANDMAGMILEAMVRK